MFKSINFFFLILPTLCFGTYYSQVNQDEILNRDFFKNKREGFFVDIGAHDGVSLSNSFFFESELGWKGICIEPNPDVFPQLVNNRKNGKSIFIQGCISDCKGSFPFVLVDGPGQMWSGLLHKYAPQHLQWVNDIVATHGGSYRVIDVKCYLLNDILDSYQVKHIDYLSIDTEGGEFEILALIDYNKFQIDAITVEDNYGDPRFIPFLESKGFKFVQRLRHDLLFVNKKLFDVR